MNNGVKRLLSSVLAVVMTVSCIPTSVFATEADTADCEHQYVEYAVTTAATCTQAGVETAVCTVEGCEATATREIPATGVHAYENGVCTGCGMENSKQQASVASEQDTEGATTGVVKNSRTNKTYIDITEALDDAKSNDIVVLTADTEARRLTVPENIALDLNGHVLEARYVTCDGNIVDYSNGNTGFLKVLQTRFRMNADNEHLPVRDGDGYRFFEIIRFKTKTVIPGKLFYFQPVFESAAHEYILTGVDYIGVTVKVRVNWTENDMKRSQEFAFNDRHVAEVIGSYDGKEYSKFFTLELFGADDINDLIFCPVIASNTGVENVYYSASNGNQPVQKFEAINSTQEYEPDTTVEIGELFRAIQNVKPTIDNSKVTVVAEAADAESTASGIYTANESNWRNSTLKFTGLGKVNITIKDENLCLPTTITVTVKPKDVQKFSAVEGVEATAKKPLLLGNLFKTMDDVIVDSNLVKIAVMDEAGGDITEQCVFTRNDEDWTKATLTVNAGGKVTVRITEGPYTYHEDVELTVMEHKFSKKTMALTQVDVDQTITLGELFFEVDNVTVENDELNVIVTDEVGNDLSGNYTFVYNESDWTASTLTIHNSGKVKVVVSESQYTYQASAELSVMEYKFRTARNPLVQVEAGQPITLDKLFAEISGTTINSADVNINVIGADFTYVPNAENWKEATLVVKTGGAITVIISESDCTYTEQHQMQVKEHKFQTAENVLTEVDARQTIALGRLFDEVDGAVVVSSDVEVAVEGAGYTYTPNTGDWKTSMLSIHSGGNVTVTISENDYTYEETVPLKVMEHKFQPAETPVTEVDAGQEITLGDLFAPVDGVTITNTLVKIAVTDAAGNALINQYSFTSKASDWMASTLTIKTGGVITVTVSENGFTYPESAMLTVTADKFEALQTEAKVVEAKDPITLGELFKAVEGAMIDSSAVTVTVTGENNADLTGKYTFTKNEADWTQAELSVELGVNATVTIHEDTHTYPASAGLKVMEHKFQKAESVLTRADAGQSITLGQLFDDVPGAVITNSDVDVAVRGAGFTYTPNAENWKQAELTVKTGGDVKVIISENDCTHTLSVDLTVMERKFTPETEIPVQTANAAISLGSLFSAVDGATIANENVTVTVTDEAGNVLGGKYTYARDENDWTASTVTVKTGGKVKVVIKEEGWNTYEATVLLAVMEDKFELVSSRPATVDAKTAIQVGTLFTGVTGAQITSDDVVITVTGADYTYTPNATNWKEATLTILTGGNVIVRIEENEYTNTKSLALTVMEHKFQPAGDPVTEIDAGESISLGDLFAAVEGAAVAGQLTVTVTDENGAVLEVLTPDAENWESTLIAVNVGGIATVKIAEGSNTHALTAQLTVMVNKFAARTDAPEKVTVGTAVLLGDLFEALVGTAYAGDQVEVTVTDANGNALATVPTVNTDAENWQDVSVTIHSGSYVKVTIKEKNDLYCNSAAVRFEAWENKFRAKQTSQTVDAGVFKLGDLFEAVSDTVNSSQVRATITGIDGCGIAHNNTDWTQGTITIPTGGEAVITLSEGTYTKTVETSLTVMEHKFGVKTNAPDAITAGTITLDKLFEKKGSAKIDDSLVNVVVTGVSGASFVQNVSDWTAAELLLPLGGVATITISEDDYTHTEFVTLTVMEDKFAQQEPAPGPVNVGDQITLGQLFRKNGDVTIDSSKVSVTVKSGTTVLTVDEDYTLTKPENAEWTDYVLTFKRTGDMVVEIGEVYTDTKTASLRVNVDKFTALEDIPAKTALMGIPLSELFNNIGEVTDTTVTVTYPDNTTSKSSVAWAGGTVRLTKGGSVKIQITDAKDSYCNTAEVWIDVVEDKFAAKEAPITEAYADVAVTLGALFENGAFGSGIDTDKLTVVVKSGDDILSAGADYILDKTTGAAWTDFMLTVAAGCDITVTIQEENNLHCNTVTLPLTVYEQKFTGISGNSIDAGSTSTITLGELFEVCENANVASDAAVTVTVMNGTTTLVPGTDYTLTPGTGWADTRLSFAHGGNVTVTIQDSTVNCLTESTVLNVKEDKFCSKEPVTVREAGTPINLGELFGLNEGAQVNDADVTVSVALPETQYLVVTDSTKWTDTTVTLYTGGLIKITIGANDGCTKDYELILEVTADKFIPIYQSEQVDAGTTLTMGQLFRQKDAKLPVDADNVQISLIGVGEENLTEKEDWTETELNLPVCTGGTVKVGIRDSEYTSWRYVQFDVITRKFADQDNAQKSADVGDQITLGQLFKKNGDVTIDASKVSITVKSGVKNLTEGEDYTLVKPAEAVDWTGYVLTFLKTGAVTVYINEEYTYTQDAALTVYVDKFSKQENIEVQTMDQPITIGALFRTEADISSVTVTLTYADESTEEKTVAWPNGTVTPTKSGTVTITVKDANDLYCNEAFVDVTVKEQKFTGKTGITAQTAGKDILLTTLFTAEENVEITLDALDVTVTDVNGDPVAAELILADNWNDCKLRINASGDITVRLTEEINTHAADASFLVKEDKFQSAEDALTEVDADTPIDLSELFAEKTAVTDALVDVKVTGAEFAYTPDANDWTQGTLEIATGGVVTVTITEKDNVYCNSYSIRLTVNEHKFDPVDIDEHDARKVIKLGELFVPREGSEANSGAVTIEIPNWSTDDYRYIPNTSDWTKTELTFLVGGDVTVIIKENNRTYTASNSFKVTEQKFAEGLSLTGQTKAGDVITLEKLFAEHALSGDRVDPEKVIVTVELTDAKGDKHTDAYSFTRSTTDDWKDGKLTITKGGSAKVTITEENNTYCNAVSVTFDVMENKFTRLTPAAQTVNVGFALNLLFGGGTDVEAVTVTVQGLDGNVFTPNADNWSDGELTIPTVGKYDVTVTETDNPYCIPVTAEVIVKAVKFEPASVAVAGTTTEEIKLNTLFDAENVDIANLSVAVMDGETPLNAGTDYAVTVGQTWDMCAVTIHKRGSYKVVITDGEYTFGAEKTVTVNEQKFQTIELATTVYTGSALRLDKLFEANTTIGDTVNLQLSVADTLYTLGGDENGWTGRTITFNSGCDVTVTIWDTDYCVKTQSYQFRVYEKPFDDARAGEVPAGEIALTTLFTGVESADDVIVTVGDSEVTVANGMITIDEGGEYTVTIRTSSIYCEPVTTEIKVMESKFKADSTEQVTVKAGRSILLGNLFDPVTGADITDADVTITVKNAAGNELTGKYSLNKETISDWRLFELIINTDQDALVWITDGTYTYAVSASVKVMQEKFVSKVTASETLEKTAGRNIYLSELFDKVTGVTVTDNDVTVAVTGTDSSNISLDTTGAWETRKLIVNTGCDIQVTISENDWTYDAFINVKVMEDKFDIADNATAKIAQNVEISAENIFKAVSNNISNGDVKLTVTADNTITAGIDYVYTPGDIWQSHKLTFMTPGTYTVTISEKANTRTVVWTLKVTEDKFAPAANRLTEATVNESFALGRIFAETMGVTVADASVNAVVTDLQGNVLTDVFVFTPNTDVWESSTLLINQTGTYIIRITEDDMSSAEELQLTVKAHKFQTVTPAEAYDTRDFTLGELFNGLTENIDASKVTVTVSGVDYEFVDFGNAAWENRIIRITSGGNAVITISEDELTFSEQIELNVMEHKFGKQNSIVTQTAKADISLTDLFTGGTGVQYVTVTVVGPENKAYDKLAWPGNIQVTAGGEYTITICEFNNTHCRTEDVHITVNENKFAGKTVTAAKTADTAFALGDLFEPVENANTIVGADITVALTDTDGNPVAAGYSLNKEGIGDWTQYQLTISEGGRFRVTIFEGQYTNTAYADVSVNERKFQAISGQQVNVGVPIALNELFTTFGDAVVAENVQLTISATDSKGEAAYTLDDAAKWAERTLTFAHGDKVTITVSETGNDYCLQEPVELKVMQTKFEAKENVVKDAKVPFDLGDLFRENGTDVRIDSSAVNISCTAVDADENAIADPISFQKTGTSWTGFQVTAAAGGVYTVTITESDYAEPVEAQFTAYADKFDQAEHVSDRFDSGEEISLSEIFQGADYGLEVEKETVAVTLTYADTDTPVPETLYAFEKDTNNWLDGKLVIRTGAKVTAAITDDAYTKPETITFEAWAKKYEKQSNAPSTVDLNAPITLGTLFKEINANLIVDSVPEIKVTDLSGIEITASEETFTYANEGADWTSYTLTFHNFMDVKVVISGTYTYAADAKLTVQTEMFTANASIESQHAKTPISLSTLFENPNNISDVALRVTYAENDVAEQKTTWTNGTVTLKQGGLVTIEIKADNETFCKYTPVTIKVIEDKFAIAASPRTTATADTAFLLGDLFDDGANFALDENADLKLTVKRNGAELALGTDYTLNTTAENWKGYGLTIHEGGKITVYVTQKDTEYCNEVSLEVTVNEHKFVGVAQTVDAGENFTLNDLFAVHESAKDDVAEVTYEVKNGTTVLTSGTTSGGWKGHQLSMAHGGTYTVTIREKDNDCCIEASATVKIMEHKFEKNEAIADKQAGVQVKLSELFHANGEPTINSNLIKVTVDDLTAEQYRFTPSDKWEDSYLTFYTGGDMTVTIIEEDGYTYEETVNVKVYADKFDAKALQSDRYDAGTSFTMEDLFAVNSGMYVNAESVTITVSGVAEDAYTLTEDADWKQQTLTVNTGAKVTVTITDDTTYTESQNAEITFYANKFTKRDDAPPEADMNEVITLGQLFEGTGVNSDDVKVSVTSGGVDLVQNVDYTLEENTADWKQTKLTFLKTMDVQVFVCETYTGTASANLKVMENVFTGNVTKTVTVKMPYNLKFSEYLTLSDSDDAVLRVSTGSAIYDWTGGPQITEGGVYTYTVTESGNEYCNPVTLTLTVIEDNFVSKGTVTKDEGETVKLGDLFTIASSVSSAYVTVDGVEDTNLTATDSVINVEPGKVYTFTITERDNDQYSTKATATLKLREKKFQAAAAKSQTAGVAFPLTDLVSQLDGKSVTNVTVTVTGLTSGTDYSHNGTWTGNLTIYKAGNYSVTIEETDNELCAPITVSVNVKEDKFTGTDTAANTNQTSNAASVNVDTIFGTEADSSEVTGTVTITVRDSDNNIVDTVTVDDGNWREKTLTFIKGGAYTVTIEEAGNLTNAETVTVEVSEYKFTAPTTQETTQNTVALGSLFTARSAVTVDNDTVKVTVKDKNDNVLTENVNYTLNKGTLARSVIPTDWTTWELILKSGTEVKVSIEDDIYCQPTETTLTYTEQKFTAKTISDPITAGDIELSALFGLVSGVSADGLRVTVKVDGNELPTMAWTNGKVSITEGGTYTITITDAAGYSNTASVNVTVNENKFTPTGKTYSDPVRLSNFSIPLTDLFTCTEEDLAVLVTVNGAQEQLNYKTGSIKITAGGSYTVKIIQNGTNTYCNEAEATFTITALNFTAKTDITPVKVGAVVNLSHLFENVGNVTNVTITVGGETTTTAWTGYKLPTGTFGTYSVTITDAAGHSNSATATLTVQEDRLTAVDSVPELTAGSPVVLSDLVKAITGKTVTNPAFSSVAVKNGETLTSGYTITSGDGWTDTLTIDAPDTYDVTVYDQADGFCAAYSVTVTVKADKFDPITVSDLKTTDEITLGSLFKLKDGISISAGATVSYTVTNTETGDVVDSGSGLAASAWASKQISIPAGGKYKVEISESDAYTGSETNTITVKQPKFVTKNSVVVEKQTVNLTELFDLAQGISENDVGAVTVTVTDLTTNGPMTAGNGYTFTSGTWTQCKLTFAAGGKVKIEITDGKYCVPATVELTVNEKKFAANTISEPIAAGDIELSALFGLASGISADGLNVAVKVDGTEAYTGAWTGGKVKITAPGVHWVSITETGNAFCVETTASIGIKTAKFKANSDTAVTVSSDTVTLGTLFSAVNTAVDEINDAKVDVTITNGGSCNANTSDWTQGALALPASGTYTVTITDGEYCIPVTCTVKKVTDKFEAKVETYTATAGEEIILRDLFKGTDVSDEVKITYNNMESIVDWENGEGTFTINDGGVYSVTITEADGNSNSATVTVTVYAEKFTPVTLANGEYHKTTVGTSITLGELFSSGDSFEQSIKTDAIKVTVTIDGTETEVAVTPNASGWKQYSFTIADRGTATVTITDNDYCIAAENTITVMENLFEVAENAPTALATVDAEPEADEIHNGHKIITVGDLFAAKDGVQFKTKETVDVTLTLCETDKALSAEQYELIAEDSDWTNWTLHFNGTADIGEVEVTIRAGEYCEETTHIINVIKATDAIKSKFTNSDKYLYRVGNLNAIKLSKLFEENPNLAEDMDVGTVSVEITPVNTMGNANFQYTPNASDWMQGTIKFTGAGIVTIRVCDDRIAEPVTVDMEVVRAYNVTANSDGIVTDWNSSNGNVLLENVAIKENGTLTLSGCTLYGNGFTLDATKAAYTAAGNDGDSFVIKLDNGKLDNVVITGAVYPSVGGTSDANYHRALILASGNSVIANSCLSNTAAPVRTGGSLEIVNTTLRGGATANLDIRKGAVVLDNVTTVNQFGSNDKTADGVEAVGLGIVVYQEGGDENFSITIKNNLTQYNYLSNVQANNIKEAYARIIAKKMFENAYSQYHLTVDGVTWVNAGIISMNDLFNGDEDIIELRKDGHGYKGMSTTVDLSIAKRNCYVYTLTPEEIKEPESYIPTEQSAIVPVLKLEYTGKNFVPITDGSNDYCIGSNKKWTISMDEGDTFEWDTAVLSFTKNGQSVELPYTVSMNGADYTGKKIPFNTAGTYTVTYTYTDKTNYGIDADANLIAHSRSYTVDVTIEVITVAKIAKHAVFSFGKNGTAYSATTVVANNKTYVMPAASTTIDGEIGSRSVGGKTIYYPITEMYTSDGKTSHYSTWYPCFPIFKDAVQIIDYAGGIEGGAEQTYNQTTVTKVANIPSTLKATNPTSAFLYSMDAVTYSPPTEPSAVSGAVCYTSNKNGLTTNGRAETTVVAEYTYTDNAGLVYYYYVGYHCAAQNQSSSGSGGGGCVTPDTLITLADGTQKRVDMLDGTEQLLVWNLETGYLDSAPIMFVDREKAAEQEVVHLYFSDGTGVKVIYEHGFWDYDLNRYVYLDGDAEQYIGHTFAKKDGDTLSKVQLTDVVLETENTTAWSPVTAGHLCYFVNGMLSMPGGIGGLFNIFNVDPNTMTYDYEAMERDIETYGLFTYEEMNAIVPLPEEMFVAAGGACLKVSIGKGNMTMDDLAYMIQRYTQFFQ